MSLVLTGAGQLGGAFANMHVHVHVAQCLKARVCMQVPWVAAEVLHRLMPAAHLHIVKGGGHFAYYVCDKKKQREALEALLNSGAPLKNTTE